MLPQRLVVIGVGNSDVNYDTKKYVCEGTAYEIGQKYGFGSPLHLAALQLFPQVGSGATFPVTFIGVKFGESEGAAASGQISIEGSATSAGTVVIDLAGLEIEVTIAKGDTADDIKTKIINAVNAQTNRVATASATSGSVVNLTSRWDGVLGNRISLEVSSDVSGVAFTVTEFANGAGTPDVTAALSEIGTSVWETFVLDTFDYMTKSNSTISAASTLDTYQTWGEGRWDTLTKMPVLVAHGCVDDFATRTAVSDARKLDYVNFFITSVGSSELPFVVAAKGLLGMLTVADENPPQNYKNALTGLSRGDDTVQEDYTVRNQSVLKGASTNIVKGSVAQLNDIVTFYHPDADGKYPSRRYVVDAVKLMNIVYNLRLITEEDDVTGAPLLPNEQATVNPTALKPKDFKTWLRNLANTLGLNAIISDVNFTRDNITVSIDSENSKRVNYVFPIKVSGNVEVVSGDVYFGRYTA
jgi:phage tail sheath gpL-like